MANTALTNAPSRRIFSPMFRARWQNLQNIVNDSLFIDMIPEPYKTYYQAYIQQWLQWSRGFVPMLHRRDFFALGIGYTICEILARECMSGGYSFQSANEEAKSFVEEWAGKEMTGTLSEMFFYGSAGGNSILALTPCCGDVYCTVYPIDRIIFSVGRKNKITKAMILNRFTAGETVYYARETRVILDGKPYYKVELARGTLITSPTWNGASIPQVPTAIEEQWQNAYGEIEPFVWYELPLKSIGLYNIRNKSFAVALSGMPGYADSSLHTALDVLYSIDYNYTQGEVDQYMGKARALVPRTMNRSGAKTIANGEGFAEAVYGDSRQPLDETFYEQIQSQTIDGNEIKPTFMQPDLRGDARKFIRDSDLEILASKVGLSSSTLANHLNYNKSKTATEFNGEQDTTETTVNEKRYLASPEIDAMIADVLDYYGVVGRVEIQWGISRINSPQQNQELLSEYNAGTLTLRQYLRRRWKELSETEIEDMAVEIEEEMAKRKNSSDGGLFNEKDYFGGGE